ncbi:hypothetical protein X474_12040 [Dethiosulfatarculus sandiegensis]|uniref:Uncharacterized protein n=1 Tax=Dethiosulfatarculus sandiegensis TaxID=1429043 RepID=A0A0D2HTV6_9BACT|nr:hypothetical protein X474_12040 [Dethiosulfatarculus sandiegensis]
MRPAFAKGKADVLSGREEIKRLYQAACIFVSW